MYFHGVKDLFAFVKFPYYLFLAGLEWFIILYVFDSFIFEVYGYYFDSFDFVYVNVVKWCVVVTEKSSMINFDSY